MQANKTYFIVVDGYSGAGGEYQLSMVCTSCPASNDAAIAAANLTESGAASGSSSGATGTTAMPSAALIQALLHLSHPVPFSPVVGPGAGPALGGGAAAAPPSSSPSLTTPDPANAPGVGANAPQTSGASLRVQGGGGGGDGGGPPVEAIGGGARHLTSLANGGAGGAAAGSGAAGAMAQQTQEAPAQQCAVKA